MSNRNLDREMTDRLPGKLTDRERPQFPKRAVVTAGMPYGNKDLHFGHVGGVFVPADAFARFLRDRIGTENVIFVSGTDCYGSPIITDYTKQVSSGDFRGSLLEYVRFNYERQGDTLQQYKVALDCFAASALDPYRETHECMGAMIMESAYRHGHLEKRSTPQFYDASKQMYLNGRQVLGRCPIQGCRSEKAYADECSLGHQYEPKDLIDPVSTLSGERPETRFVTNWYLPLEKFRKYLLPWFERLLKTGEWRDFAVRMVLEYFEAPTIYVKRASIDAAPEVIGLLPPHRRETGKGQSDKFIFENLAAQDAARTVLGHHRLRYRSGKTLVPFRLTGNLEWGLAAPKLEGLADLTFWVWPESLWAPISFTASLLRQRGAEPDAWKQWWSSKDAKIYQFIGEDNLFFYGVAEMALFLATQEGALSTDVPEGQLQLPCIVANRHILFLDTKASSSGAVQPPMAKDLLEFYSPDQLRIHFLSLALGARNVSFRPKPLDPTTVATMSDPVLKDGNLLSNAFNKAARSCFYTSQKYYDRRLPEGDVSEEVVEQAKHAILDYEAAMARQELHVAAAIAAAYIREINARWSRHSPYREECDSDTRRRATIDAFHMVRVAIVLLHPIAPVGTEKVKQHLRVGDEIWNWNRIFDPLSSFLQNPSEHQFAYLAPKEDFFEKPACQVNPAP